MHILPIRKADPAGLAVLPVEVVPQANQGRALPHSEVVVVAHKVLERAEAPGVRLHRNRPSLVVVEAGDLTAPHLSRRWTLGLYSLGLVLVVTAPV